MFIFSIVIAKLQSYIGRLQFKTAQKFNIVVHNSFCSLIGRDEIHPSKLSSIGEISDGRLKGDENRAELPRLIEFQKNTMKFIYLQKNLKAGNSLGQELICNLCLVYYKQLEFTGETKCKMCTSSCFINSSPV